MTWCRTRKYFWNEIFSWVAFFAHVTRGQPHPQEGIGFLRPCFCSLLLASLQLADVSTRRWQEQRQPTHLSILKNLLFGGHCPKMERKLKWKVNALRIICETWTLQRTLELFFSTDLCPYFKDPLESFPSNPLCTFLSNPRLFQVLAITFIEYLLHEVLYTCLLFHLTLIALEWWKPLCPFYSPKHCCTEWWTELSKCHRAYSPHPCYTKCGSLTNSISMTWELVRNADPQAPTQTCCIKS